MNPKTSADLFNKIRSQFSNIEIGDTTGQPTADPSEAVFFDFEFKEDADTYGRVSISLADEENMKVFYNRDLVEKIDDDSRDEWYAFLKVLKDFAVEHSLRFDVRDITKSNLTKQDYKNLADTNTTVNTDTMSEELNRITTLAGVKETEDKQKHTEKETKHIKQRKGDAWLGDTRGHEYLFKNLIMENLANLVSEKIKLYTEMLCLDNNQLSFFYQRSWATITKSKERIQPHSHDQSNISFAYYLSKPENSGNIRFISVPQNEIAKGLFHQETIVL